MGSPGRESGGGRPTSEYRQGGLRSESELVHAAENTGIAAATAPIHR